MGYTKHRLDLTKYYCYYRLCIFMGKNIKGNRIYMFCDPKGEYTKNVEQKNINP